MPTTLGVKLQHFQQRLTRLDREPLGKAALVIILLLDLFILTSIFDGLGAHTAQLTSPYEYIPALCRDMVLDEEWNETSRLGKLANLVSKYRGSYYPAGPARRSCSVAPGVRAAGACLPGDP